MREHYTQKPCNKPRSVYVIYIFQRAENQIRDIGTWALLISARAAFKPTRAINQQSEQPTLIPAARMCECESHRWWLCCIVCAFALSPSLFCAAVIGRAQFPLVILSDKSLGRKMLETFFQERRRPAIGRGAKVSANRAAIGRAEWRVRHSPRPSRSLMRDKRAANGLFMGQVDTFLAYHRLTCSAAARQEITLSLGRVVGAHTTSQPIPTLAQEIQEETIKEHNTHTHTPAIQHKLPGVRCCWCKPFNCAW
jgi:hypothetical protein